MQFSFYQVTVNYHKALCQVIDKCHQTGNNTIIHTATDELQLALDKSLWSYGRRTFIPHGTKDDEQIDKFSVFLSREAENVNNATILVLTHPDLPIDNGYERVLIVFEGDDEQSVKSARKRYKELKDLGNSIDFFFQDKKGVWEKKGE